jgi:molybdopterin converting factor subunit 1
MKARVRLFARLSELAGTRELEVELGEGLTAGGVYDLLSRRYPAIEGMGGSLMYALNAEYVRPDHPVRDGDELALIPPVSGGSDAV